MNTTGTYGILGTFFIKTVRKGSQMNEMNECS